MESVDKYIVFKRDEFEKWCIPTTFDAAEKLALQDAVVIRRQDKFASPCLATYAAMIALVASELPEGEKRTQLLQVADHFEDQARLAAEEGWKFPD